MINRLLARIAITILALPAAAGATNPNLPLSNADGGQYVAGFEVESMADEVGGEKLTAVRYMARLGWRPAENWALSLRAGGSEMTVESVVHGTPTNFGGQAKLAIGGGGTWMRPLREDFLSFWADGQVLYTLSYGNTTFETTIQSSTFEENYENRYAWNEYQGAAGIQVEIPWARFYSGALVRSVDGSVSRKTFKADTGDLLLSSKEDFSKEARAFGLLGMDIPVGERMVFSISGHMRSEDLYSWTIAISEFSH